ncbi:MAG: amino acid permease [Phycisphaeraceae bacterium]|nr:amino acid permease [Phycisphaeraceae bacterium]
MAGIVVSQKRPRVLKWFHAGPLLFGDWGTSRLYVLGLAFYYTAHASVLYLVAMSLIMAAVAWAYSVICRCFPEGGGVYAAARQLSPTLSVIGATLLLCDYIVTASLSVIEGFHYFGAPQTLTVLLSILTIIAIGIINWFGARSAGRFALLVAIAAIIFSAVVAILSLPLLAEGFSRISSPHDSISSAWARWESLVRIILALSGLEAVANMTGLMHEPVARTAKRTIWPVLIEVVLLNLIFGIAISALPQIRDTVQPDYVTHEVVGRLDSDAVPPEVKEYRDTAMKMLAIHTGQQAFGTAVGTAFGIGAAIVFGLLLLSAVNTAVMAMVAVLYSLGQDKEVPRPLTRLNYSGVPWIGLLIACALPAALLLIEADVKALGELYAIGVVGAISINVVSCAINVSLPIGRWERRFMWAVGLFMSAVELTIIVAKPRAAIFAGVMITAVLCARAAVRWNARRALRDQLPVPELGWLNELRREPLSIDPSRPRIMLAARGRQQAEFAVDLARRRGATLFAIYVRTLRVLDMGPGYVPRVEDDPGAQEALGSVAMLARQYRVPFVPIYACSPDIAEEILDYTATYGCDTLIMGKTGRSLFSRQVAGDVLAQVAQHLPDGVALITREATPHPLGPPPQPVSGADTGRGPDARG